MLLRVVEIHLHVLMLSHILIDGSFSLRASKHHGTSSIYSMFDASDTSDSDRSCVAKRRFLFADNFILLLQWHHSFCLICLIERTFIRCLDFKSVSWPKMSSNVIDKLPVNYDYWALIFQFESVLKNHLF